jgi:hypothetical protein
MFDIDFSDLEEFHLTLQKLENDFPKEAKQMITKIGNKAKNIVSKKANQLVSSGNYTKSIKRGKVWNEQGQLTVRVYSTDPKKFWIENGHRIVDKNGKEHGFKQGYKVFDKSTKEIDDNFSKIVETELDKIFNKL